MSEQEIRDKCTKLINSLSDCDSDEKMDDLMEKLKKCIQSQNELIAKNESTIDYFKKELMNRERNMIVIFKP